MRGYPNRISTMTFLSLANTTVTLSGSYIMSVGSPSRMMRAARPINSETLLSPAVVAPIDERWASVFPSVGAMTQGQYSSPRQGQLSPGPLAIGIPSTSGATGSAETSRPGMRLSMLLALAWTRTPLHHSGNQKLVSAATGISTCPAGPAGGVATRSRSCSPSAGGAI